MQLSAAAESVALAFGLCAAATDAQDVRSCTVWENNNMHRIADAEQQIRKYVNAQELYELYFEDHLDDWNRLTTAMDLLGDTALALQRYEIQGFGDEDGTKYLLFYGTFQALVLQQDSIRELYSIFCEKQLIPDTNSAWMRIRELRNLAAGHPIDKKGTPDTGNLRIFVSRISISESGFDLIICEETTANTRAESVSLRQPYEVYKNEALNYLDEIRKAQKRRWPE